MGAPFVDWEAVRLAYISSVKSYRQVANEMGVSYSKIRAHGKDEDWPAQRVAYQREAAERAIASGIAQEADRLGKIINAANAMADVIEGVFEDEQQFHRHLVPFRQDKDEETVERAMQDILKRSSEYIPTPEAILECISKYYGLEESIIRGQQRVRDAVAARQIAMYLIRSMTNLSLDDIGKQFDNRDHSTVLYSIKQVEKQMKKDAAFAETVKAIKTNINSRR